MQETELKLLFKRFMTKEGYAFEPIDMEALEQVLDEMENHISGNDSLLIFANRIKQIIK